MGPWLADPWYTVDITNNKSIEVLYFIQNRKKLILLEALQKVWKYNILKKFQSFFQIGFAVGNSLSQKTTFFFLSLWEGGPQKNS